MLLVADTILAERLDKLLEFTELSHKRRPFAAGEIFIGICLKRLGQSVGLIRLEIYRPARRFTAYLFFNVITNLIFPCVPFKGAQTSRNFNRIQAAVALCQPFETVAAGFNRMTLLLHFVESSRHSRFQNPS